jgi:hypothetical protein
VTGNVPLAVWFPSILCGMAVAAWLLDLPEPSKAEYQREVAGVWAQSSRDALRGLDHYDRAHILDTWREEMRSTANALSRIDPPHEIEDAHLALVAGIRSASEGDVRVHSGARDEGNGVATLSVWIDLRDDPRVARATRELAAKGYPPFGTPEEK